MIDTEAAVVEEMIEHAPGEGAMRAAALQRQADAFLRFARARRLTIAARPGK